MGEIRSTIDIMMERTRGMVLSPEEKRKIRLEEIGRKAKGVHLRLVQDPEQMESALTSLSHDSPEDGDLFRSLLWNTFVENIPSGHDTAAYLKLMASISVDSGRSKTLEELVAALKTAEKNRSRDMKTLVVAARKKLADAGISGSAVVPRVEGMQDSYNDIINKYKKLLVYQLD